MRLLLATEDGMLAALLPGANSLMTIAQCADESDSSMDANDLKLSALGILTSAATFSGDGHQAVLAALDALRRERHYKGRLGWLVAACARFQLDHSLESGWALEAEASSAESAVGRSSGRIIASLEEGASVTATMRAEWARRLEVQVCVYLEQKTQI